MAKAKPDIPVKKAILSKKEKSPPVSLYDADVNDANYPDEGIPGYKDYANLRPAAIERAKGNSRDTDIELKDPNVDYNPKRSLDAIEKQDNLVEEIIKRKYAPKRKKSVASY